MVEYKVGAERWAHRAARFHLRQKPLRSHHAREDVTYMGHAKLRVGFAGRIARAREDTLLPNIETLREGPSWVGEAHALDGARRRRRDAADAIIKNLREEAGADTAASGSPAAASSEIHSPKSHRR